MKASRDRCAEFAAPAPGLSKSDPDVSAVSGAVSGEAAVNQGATGEVAKNAVQTTALRRHGAVDYSKWDRVTDDDDCGGNGSLSSTGPTAEPSVVGRGSRGEPSPPPAAPELVLDQEAEQWLLSNGPTEEEQVALADIEQVATRSPCSPNLPSVIDSGSLRE